MFSVQYCILNCIYCTVYWTVHWTLPSWVLDQACIVDILDHQHDMQHQLVGSVIMYSVTVIQFSIQCSVYSSVYSPVYSSVYTVQWVRARRWCGATVLYTVHWTVYTDDIMTEEYSISVYSWVCSVQYSSITSSDACRSTVECVRGVVWCYCATVLL